MASFFAQLGKALNPFRTAPPVATEKLTKLGEKKGLLLFPKPIKSLIGKFEAANLKFSPFANKNVEPGSRSTNIQLADPLGLFSRGGLLSAEPAPSKTTPSSLSVSGGVSAPELPSFDFPGFPKVPEQRRLSDDASKAILDRFGRRRTGRRDLVVAGKRRGGGGPSKVRSLLGGLAQTGGTGSTGA